jgi:hypothetical protein
MVHFRRYGAFFHHRTASGKVAEQRGKPAGGGVGVLYVAYNVAVFYGSAAYRL